MTATGETATGPRMRAARDQLRRMILDGSLAPGSRHLEQSLAAQLGISRTPLREAALLLAAEGLVTIQPRLGIRINPVSARDMAEIYDILTALEPEAAAGIARAGLSEEGRAALEAAVAEMDARLGAGDLAGWAEADHTFHKTLVELSENRRLVAIISALWDQVHRARMATLKSRSDLLISNADHRALVDLIASGDVAGAVALHRAHRSRARHVLVALLEDGSGEDDA